MSSPRITLTYSGTTGLIVDDPYWIRIDQETVADDTATVIDAAELIDAAYSIDACDKDPEPITDDPTSEQLAVAVGEQVSFVACDYDPSGNVDVFLHIVRSTITEPYRLQLRGGVVKLTEVINGPVTVVQKIESGSSLTLPYPVLAGFSFAWQGAVYGDKGIIDPPNITRIGNTIGFGASIKSATIKATYQSQYDRVTVTVLGTKDGEPGECRALAFLHGLVDVHDCELPNSSALDPVLCTDKWQTPPSNDQVTCYYEVHVVPICSCSGQPAGRYNPETDLFDSMDYMIEEEVPCPGEYHCVNNDTECMALLGSKTRYEYVECAYDNGLAGSGGVVQTVSLPGFYLEKCCTLPEFPLPQCWKKTISHRGNYPVHPSPDFYRGLYGDLTRFVAVSPPGGICGEMVIEQRIMGSDCCAGAEPLEFDTSISATIVAQGASAVIATSGGVGPYRFRIDSGSDLFFSNGRKQLVIGQYMVAVSTLVGITAGASFCGTAQITVFSECNMVATWGVMSPVGRWVIVQQADRGFVPCPVSGFSCPDVSFVGYTGQHRFSVTQGGVRLSQTITWGVGEYGFHATRSEAYAACMDSYASGFPGGVHSECNVSPDFCGFCFDVSPYEPCRYSESWDHSTLGDPRRETGNCAQPSYGWMWYEPSVSGYPFTWRSQAAAVTNSVVEEWRC